jgi:hypothetical protein
LDREADDQYHYYQPGIGTYVISGSRVILYPPAECRQ